MIFSAWLVFLGIKCNAKFYLVCVRILPVLFSNCMVSFCSSFFYIWQSAKKVCVLAALKAIIGTITNLSLTSFLTFRNIEWDWKNECKRPHIVFVLLRVMYFIVANVLFTLQHVVLRLFNPASWPNQWKNFDLINACGVKVFSKVHETGSKIDWLENCRICSHPICS